MTMDFTRLIDRLDPPADGESPVRHRTGTVAAINSDGTIDVNLGGVVVPEVQTLMSTTVGSVVQVLVWKGDLLALGTAGRLGVLGYEQVTANQTGITTITTLTNLTVDTSSVPAGRRLKVTGKIDVLVDTVSDTTARLYIADAALAVVQSARNRPVGNNRAATLIVVAVVASGSANYRLRLEREVGTGTLAMIAAATNPAFILAEDIGPA